VKNAPSQHGFTLIEVVIAIFILILMLVFYVSAFSSNQLAKIQAHKDIALRVINQKMASLRAGGYGSVGSGGTFTDTQLNTLQSAAASTTVSDYNASIKEVTVGVSWIDASSTQYLSETTLIINSGGL
jgi:prepilin-type N-terminal cleavage/methylation domain-containing protein